MQINKITVGFVIQTFDTNSRKYTSQEFIAGDDVQYEQDGAPVDAKLMEDEDGTEPYLPFTMKQPNDHQIVVDIDHLAMVVDLATQNRLDSDDPELAEGINIQNAAIAAVNFVLESMRAEHPCLAIKRKTKNTNTFLKNFKFAPLRWDSLSHKIPLRQKIRTTFFSSGSQGFSIATERQLT